SGDIQLAVPHQMPSRPRLTTSTMSQSSLQMVPLCSRESFSRSKALRILATAAPAPPSTDRTTRLSQLGSERSFHVLRLVPKAYVLAEGCGTELLAPAISSKRNERDWCSYDSRL